jgi:MinD superfamily P-loop ATPase
MRQLVVLSGKGGTGKTSVTASLAHLALSMPQSVSAVVADVDVDAANLALLMKSAVITQHKFISGQIAEIDQARCMQCGRCELVCRYDAVKEKEYQFIIDPLACEGCAACVYQCPAEAIKMEPQLAGYLYHSQSCYGPLFHAELLPGQENSGKLVSAVKEQARIFTNQNGFQLLLIDGAPGIGCPVISAVTGTDLALVVAEPTVSGIHDLKRILKTIAHFRIPAVVCVNKVDVYPEGVQMIKDYCHSQKINIIGELPFEPLVTSAMVAGEPVTAFAPKSKFSQALSQLYLNLIEYLFQ